MIYSRQFGLFVIPLECGDRSLLPPVPCVPLHFHRHVSRPTYVSLLWHAATRVTQTSNFTRAYFFLFHEYSAHIHANIVVARTGTRTDVMEPTVRRKPGRESPSVFGAGDSSGVEQPPLILWVMRFTIVPFILFRDLLRQQRITTAPYTAYIVQCSCIGNVALPLLHHGFGSCHNLDAFFDASFVSLTRGR